MSRNTAVLRHQIFSYGQPKPWKAIRTELYKGMALKDTCFMPKQLKDSGKQFALCITGALNKTVGSKVNHLSGMGGKKKRWKQNKVLMHMCSQSMLKVKKAHHVLIKPVCKAQSHQLHPPPPAIKEKWKQQMENWFSVYFIGLLTTRKTWVSSICGKKEK